MVLLLQLDQEVVGISRIFSTVLETQYTDYGWLSGVLAEHWKKTGIYIWERRHSMFEWILKMYINEEWDKTPEKNHVWSVSEQVVICYEAGRYFIVKFSIHCRFVHDEAGIFRVLFYFEMDVARSNRLLGCGRLQLPFTSLTSVSGHCKGGVIWS